MPTQCIEFLGFLLDSSSMTVRLTSPERDKLVQMCQKFLQPNKSYTGLCDPLRPTVKGLLMFLHSSYRKGMSYSSLNTTRSAVSNLDFDIGFQIPQGRVS